METIATRSQSCAERATTTEKRGEIRTTFSTTMSAGVTLLLRHDIVGYDEMPQPLRFGSRLCGPIFPAKDFSFLTPRADIPRERTGRVRQSGDAKLDNHNIQRQQTVTWRGESQSGSAPVVSQTVRSEAIENNSYGSRNTWHAFTLPRGHHIEAVSVQTAFRHLVSSEVTHQ